jgi:asparagine synthase (glutamine-hydrolysing)
VVARAAFAIPGRDKIRGRQGKLALKRAAEAWLPKEIIYRPKASFSAPLRAWVRNDLRDVINDTLVNGELAGAGMLRPAALNRLIEAERAGREDNAKQIWQLLSMELWYRNARSMGVAA